ncbi:MAG: glycosyltransferase [Cyanobacteriota bacterium]
MKILLINNFFSNVAGAENLAYEEYNLLHNIGHEVFFFATSRQPYFISNYIYSKYFPEYIDFRSATLFTKFRNILKIFHNNEAAQKLDLMVNKIKPDIAHLHNIDYHLSPSVLKCLYKNNIPVVITLHDTRLICPGGTLQYKSTSFCNDLLCLKGNPLHCIVNRCKENSLTKSTLVSLENIYRKYYNLYDYVSLFICPSQALADLLVRSGVKSSKIKVINNFVPDSLVLQDFNNDNNNYFLYTGRLTSYKGIYTLISVFKELPDISLHIVGKGEEEHNIRNIIDSEALSNIHIQGFKTGKALEEEYINSIATIIPSEWFENFPLSVLESFSHGKAVIGSNLGGIPEIIDNDINGIIINYGDIVQLKSSILKLYQNRTLAKELGKNARNKYERCYTPDLYLSRLIEAFLHMY